MEMLVKMAEVLVKIAVMMMAPGGERWVKGGCCGGLGGSGSKVVVAVNDGWRGGWGGV